MSKTIRHVLKAAAVTLEPPFPLSLDPTAAAPGSGSRSVAAASSARIAQNHADYAVIEITCPCGRTTYVRCDYAAASPAPTQQEPNQG